MNKQDHLQWTSSLPKCAYISTPRKLQDRVIPYILRLKDMANHFVLPLSVLGRVRCFHIILGVRPWHSPTSHQNNYISYICNVRNGPQGMIHHGFLGNTKNNISSCFNKVLTAYLVLWKQTNDNIRPLLSEVCNTCHAWWEMPIENKSSTFQKQSKKQVLQIKVVFSVEKHIKTSVSEPEYAGHVCIKDYKLQIMTTKHCGLLWAQSILDVSWLIRNELTAISLPANSNNF